MDYGNLLIKAQPGQKFLEVLSGGKEVLYINDVVVRNNAGNSEVYVASSVGYNWETALTISTMAWFFRLWTIQVTNGTSFSRINVKIDGTSTRYQPMDLEIAPDNKVWDVQLLVVYGSGGGTILYQMMMLQLLL